jgi:hypothetical protein
MEVFLGGTCAESGWREELIPLLDMDYFNPVVDDWTEDDYQIELEKRKSCDFILYVITPRMEGVYSIAEVVDDSNKRPDITIFCVLEEDNKETDGLHDKTKWTKSQRKSLTAVERMIENNGALVVNSLQDIAEVLNVIESET